MADLEKLVGLLMGAAFVARVADGNKPVWARAAYGAVGVDLLRAAMRAAEVNPALYGATSRPSKLDVDSAGRPVVKLNFEERRANSINERVSQIHEQMVKGTRDPKVYALARSVLSRKCGGEWCVPERDSLAEISALFAEVRQRVRYTWDPIDYDAFQTPGKSLELGAGDCDDQVALLGALLRTIGYRVRSRVVHTEGFPTWNHIYLLVELPGKGEWMALDPTVNKPPGWQVPKAIMKQQPRDFDVVEKGGSTPRLV